MPIDVALRRRLVAEAVGTFTLVFIGPGAAVVDAWSAGALGRVGVALSFTFVVLALVSALGHVSGGHFNPAVSVGFWSSRRLSGRDLGAYVAAQVVAATAASFTLRYLLAPHVSAAVTHPVIGAVPTLLVEFLLTAFLMLVIMGVATDARADGRLAGVAIGCAVGFDALVGGPLTGASMNPARSFGPALAANDWAAHWSYWAGPMLGAVVGARLYEFLRPGAGQ
jgi:MIP family channel proteins